MKILRERFKHFQPFGQHLIFHDGSREFDPECAQTTAILTAELYNGQAAKNEAGEWVAAPGGRKHDWETNLVGFHVGLTMIGAGSDGKHIYDYTVITPTEVAFHGSGKADGLHVPSGWDTIRVAAEAIAWMCVGPDDGVEAPTMDTAQTMWYYSVNRESASGDIDEWIDAYDRNEYTPLGEPREEYNADAVDTLVERYINDYIHGNQSGLVTRLLGDYSDYLSWEDVTNQYPDVYSMSADKLAALVDECEESTDAWKKLVELDSDDYDHLGDTPEEIFDNVTPGDLNDEDLGLMRDRLSDRLEPQEIYEWWLADEWLAKQLEAIGEPTLTDGSSHWWGRTCTGQMIKMDGTLQQIAAKFVQYA